jgi:hypothetical protein
MTVLTLLLKNWSHISGECQRLVGWFGGHAATGPHHAHPDRDTLRNEPRHRIKEPDAASPPGIPTWYPGGRPALEHLNWDFHSSSPQLPEAGIFRFMLSAPALYAQTAALVPVSCTPKNVPGPSRPITAEWTVHIKVTISGILLALHRDPTEIGLGNFHEPDRRNAAETCRTRFLSFRLNFF